MTIQIGRSKQRPYEFKGNGEQWTRRLLAGDINGATTSAPQPLIGRGVADAGTACRAPTTAKSKEGGS
jgi:hypothetical protein